MGKTLTDSIRELQVRGKTPVISEVKLRTPRDGDLIKGRVPAELAEIMASVDVAGISVVTEPEHFGGSMQILAEVAGTVDKPVLHKDFIRTAGQVEESKRLGSSAILLIASMLDDPDLVFLHKHAESLGLETVVEAHTAEELKRVLCLDIKLNILGINNRNITILETDPSDVSVTESLMPEERGDFVILSESSFKTPDEVHRALQSGADCVLIGTAVMQADDVRSFLWKLINT